MTHLTDILKWTHRRETTATAGAVTRESSRLTEINGRSLPSGVWPATFVNPRDGSTMRLVPGGTFFMGSSRQDTETARNLDADGERFDLTPETPQFDLFVPTFYLGVFAVTNGQFVRFLSERQPSAALFDLWIYSVAHIIKPPRGGEPYRVEPRRGNAHRGTDGSAGAHGHPGVHGSRDPARRAGGSA